MELPEPEVLAHLIVLREAAYARNHVWARDKPIPEDRISPSFDGMQQMLRRWGYDVPADPRDHVFYDT